MNTILEHFLIEFLKQQGYETVERKALEMLKIAFEMKICAYLKGLSSFKTLSQKENVTLIDVLFLCKNSLPTVYSNRNNSTIYEETLVEEECEFVSPLANTVERYIHIYDFMPDFPPTHTFKQTYVSPNAKENKSFSVKSRLEQSLRSESNLLKLIKSSGALPPFINYLYKRNRYN